MDNNLTYHLECVINALNKAEKKRFQLYLNKNADKENLKFVQLFRLIERYQKFDQKKFLTKHPSIKLQQLSNLKRHLLNKILQTLRQKEAEHDTDIKIREQLDNAQALFNKGFSINQVYSHSKDNAFKLASGLNAMPCNDIKFITDESDLYIIAIKKFIKG